VTQSEKFAYVSKPVEPSGNKECITARDANDTFQSGPMVSKSVSDAFPVLKVRDQNCSSVMLVIGRKTGYQDLVMVDVNTDSYQLPG
jgi:hypothetical protein